MRSPNESTLVKLYVQGIPFSTEDSELRTIFARVAIVTECRVVRDFDGRSRGFAFVTLDLWGKERDAWRVLQGHPILDHQKPDEPPRTISIDYANKRDGSAPGGRGPTGGAWRT